MTRLEALLLSYFDDKKGPTISHVMYLEGRGAPIKLPLDVRKEVAKFIDMQTGVKFFTYGFKNYTSANLYFEIPSDLARGKREILCLTVLLHSGKPESLKETLLAGSQRLKAIPNIYLAFHVNATVPDTELTQKQLALTEFLSNLCQEVLNTLAKVSTLESERVHNRDQIRDQKRDRDRDEVRDRKRDSARDVQRDEERDRQRDSDRDLQRDEERDR